MLDVPRATGDVLAVLLSPFSRIQVLTDDDRAKSVVLSTLSLVYDHVFLIGFCVLVVLNALDYLLGVGLARAEGRFQGELAYIGALSKVSGLFMALLFRLAEWWAHAAGIFPIDTGGMLASAAIFGLMMAEFHSLIEKRRRIAGSDASNGVLSAILAAFKQLSEGKAK